MSFVHTARRARLLVAIVSASILAFALVACGDDDDEGDGGEPVTEVTLTADDAGAPDEFTFELSATPTADTTTVVFDNQGEEDHALVFGKINEGFTVDEAVELEGGQGSAETLIETGAGPGESQTLEIEKPLEPGHYAMLCPIESPEGPHYKLGQLEEFDIE